MSGRGRGGRGYSNPRGGMTSGPNREGGVPGTIKCLVCNKMKSKDEFSNRQLLKFSPYNKGYTRSPDSVKVTCTRCTASQVSELKCCVCGTVKGLDGFAKTQRKDPDNARCIKCVNRDLETEPDLLPPDSEEEEESDGGSEDEDWNNKSTKKKNAPPRNPPLQAPLANRNWADDDDYTESSASSQNFGPSISSNHTAAQRSQGGYASQSSQYPDSTKGGDDDQWETVGAAQPKQSFGAPRGGAPPGQMSYRANPAPPKAQSAGGWAKVKKVPKGKEIKWGQEEPEEYVDHEEEINEGKAEWAEYGRTIRDQKDGRGRGKKKW